MAKFTEQDKIRAILSKYLIGDGCFEWLGCRDKFMYGRISRPTYGTMYPHIFMYRTFVGPVPEGLELDHLCRNPGCGRPDHMEAVTHKVNRNRSPLNDYRPTTARKWAWYRSKNSAYPCGHLRTEENTNIRDRGGKGLCRECRTCALERARRGYRRRKGA